MHKRTDYRFVEVRGVWLPIQDWDGYEPSLEEREADALAAMSEKQFEAYLKSLPNKNLQRKVG